MPLRWAWLLGMALMAPIALPAGGADRDNPAVRRRRPGEPLYAIGIKKLQVSPHHQAPLLVKVSDSDMPMQILHTWYNQQGERWCRVSLGGFRGWLLG